MTSNSPDDLASLFGPVPAGASQDMRFRQGVIQTWNPITAQNTVRVGSTILTDVPVFNTSEAILLAAGDVVAIGVIGDAGGARTYGIWGRMVIPGTASAGTSLSALRASSANVTTSASTNSTTYTDLSSSFGPTLTDVLVGATGRLLVFISSEASGVAVAGAAIETGGALMGFDLTGATVSAAAANSYMEARIRYDATPNSTMELNIRVSATRMTLLAGLNPGLHTITAKYLSVSGSTATFQDRNLTAISL